MYQVGVICKYFTYGISWSTTTSHNFQHFRGLLAHITASLDPGSITFWLMMAEGFPFHLFQVEEGLLCILALVELGEAPRYVDCQKISTRCGTLQQGRTVGQSTLEKG